MALYEPPAMLKVSLTPRLVRLLFISAALISLIPLVSAGSLPTGGTWSPPEQMPSWVTPTAFVILIAVYALIVFELVHRALAAALGGIAVVVALHTLVTGLTWGPW